MTSLKQSLQNEINSKTKPSGSLGDIETIALNVGLIQNTLRPNVDTPKAFVFGADHGVCEEGINPFPQAVTEMMLANFANGGAAMNVFCRSNHIPLTVVNMGLVNGNARWPTVLHHAIANGTANLARSSAMTATQCEQAIEVGRTLAKQAVENGHNCLLIGEMGIGNTTSASALLSALSGRAAAECVGPGTGASAQQQQLKARSIEQALTRFTDRSPKNVLAEVGGFEIAAMVGVLLAAKELNTPVLVDGFISTAAALVAERMQPGSRSAWLFAHHSAEPAHHVMLELLEAKPILNLNLRLGEGTGAALAYPIVRCAVDMLNQMATFESAGISV